MTYSPQPQAHTDAIPERRQDGRVDIRAIPDLPIGFYNVAAWEENGHTFLLGRQVDEPGAPGDGDPGALVLITLQGDTVMSVQNVWQPDTTAPGTDRVEDMRAVEHLGALVVAFTRLAYSHETERYQPFPAVAITSTEALRSGRFPDVRHIQGLGAAATGATVNEQYLEIGKNATPIGGPFGHRHFMFRPEDQNHALVVFSLNSDHQAMNQQLLRLPDGQIPWWGRDRMGTTMPPVWLNNREAVLVIHGFTRDADGRPCYAIGSSRLYVDDDGVYHIDNVSSEPLLTPKQAAALYPGQAVQLHPEERDALYMCGGIVMQGPDGKPRHIRGYPSLGDTRTFEAIFDVAAITRGWQRPELGAA